MPTVLLNLLFTILAELPVHLVGLRKRPPLQVGLVCILLNGLTLPLATWLFFRYGLDYWWVEAGVFLVEGVVLSIVWDMKIGWALLLSLVANLASIGLGEILF